MCTEGAAGRRALNAGARHRLSHQGFVWKGWGVGAVFGTSRTLEHCVQFWWQNWNRSELNKLQKRAITIRNHHLKWKASESPSISFSEIELSTDLITIHTYQHREQTLDRKRLFILANILDMTSNATGIQARNTACALNGKVTSQPSKQPELRQNSFMGVCLQKAHGPSPVHTNQWTFSRLFHAGDIAT